MLILGLRGPLFKCDLGYAPLIGALPSLGDDVVLVCKLENEI